MSRLQRHLYLLLLSTVLLLAGTYLLPYASDTERLSVASAWLCMAYLVAALCIGPVRRAAGRPAPLNIYVRRDLGIWAALIATVHFFAGTAVSMDGAYVGAFVRAATQPPSAEVRDLLFVWGSIAGTVVAVLFLFLVMLSFDRVMRWLSPARWKTLQKSAHLVLWLTVAHGIAYQVLEARWLPLIVLSGVFLATLWLQYRGRARG